MIREYKKNIEKDFAKRDLNTCYNESSIVFTQLTHSINLTVHQYFT